MSTTRQAYPSDVTDLLTELLDERLLRPLFAAAIPPPSKLAGLVSTSCRFHWAIRTGCTPNSVASSFKVYCPLTGSNATRALNSLLCRRRTVPIRLGPLL